MSMRRSDGIAFMHADLGHEGLDTVRVHDGRIVAIGDRPEARDCIVDLCGERLIPGLINSHDHLQLNSFPPFAASGRYLNAREWIADVNEQRQRDQFARVEALPRDTRLWMGGLKNLLSGVTTVAHHDPLYPFLTSRHYPTGIVTRYGWAHSLQIDGVDKVRTSNRATSPDQPWIIHAAEGVDDEAKDEFDRLDTLGCVGANTLIVHGVALDRTQRARLAEAGAGLIWCPTSNLRLFSRTAEVSELARGGRVALGTDSRLTGSQDLLCEIKAAHAASTLEANTLESMVTRDAAALLRLPDRGALRVGARADLLVLPDGMALSSATRADIRLVMVGGRALYADADYARIVAPPSHWAAVRVDGRAKMLERGLVTALSAATVGEPGLETSESAWRAA